MSPSNWAPMSALVKSSSIISAITSAPVTLPPAIIDVSGCRSQCSLSCFVRWATIRLKLSTKVSAGEQLVYHLCDHFCASHPYACKPESYQPQHTHHQGQPHMEPQTAVLWARRWHAYTIISRLYHNTYHVACKQVPGPSRTYRTHIHIQHTHSQGQSCGCQAPEQLTFEQGDRVAFQGG